MKQTKLPAGSAGWGYNALGQLGLGDTVNRGSGPDEMVQDP